MTARRWVTFRSSRYIFVGNPNGEGALVTEYAYRHGELPTFDIEEDGTITTLDNRIVGYRQEIIWLKEIVDVLPTAEAVVKILSKSEEGRARLKRIGGIKGVKETFGSH